MIIKSSNVDMYSTRNYSKTVQSTSTSTRWAYIDGTKVTDSYSSTVSYEENNCYCGSDNYDYLSSTFPSYGQNTEQSAHAQNVQLTADTSIGIEADNFLANRHTKQSAFLYLLEMIQKSRFKKLFSDNDLFNQLTSSSNSNILVLTSSSNSITWNQVSTNSYFMEENETTAYTSQGTVVTAGGRSLSFNITMEMSRSFTESSDFACISQYKQILTDPLVINLDSNPTSITDKTFMFDLDCDGKKEELAQMTSGNGYLALDKNGDGIINNGSELFGTSTGNGFCELAVYDSDNNGWIDEADEIYSQLRIWTKDESGSDQLITLKSANIGAICLESSDTPFSLKDKYNNTTGMVRSTGIYLNENGTAGTIQQVDF